MIHSEINTVSCWNTALSFLVSHNPIYISTAKYAHYLARLYIVQVSYVHILAVVHPSTCMASLAFGYLSYHL